MTDRLTLVPGQWYGWTMYPGYLGSPYHSPIRVERVTPVGSRMFDLTFFNMGYAAGVQMMNYRLRKLRREAGYMLAAQDETHRSVSIIPLDPMFIMVHAPQHVAELERLMEETGSFDAAMDRLSGYVPAPCCYIG